MEGNSFHIPPPEPNQTYSFEWGGQKFELSDVRFDGYIIQSFRILKPQIDELGTGVEWIEVHHGLRIVEHPERKK